MDNILEYLEKTVSMYPDRPAVDDGSVCFNWSELLRLSRKMGAAISGHTKSGKPVAVLAEKNAVTLAAMFGIIYAGCFYVIIDPSQPSARLKEIFRVLEPEFVIVDNKNEKCLEEAEYCGKSYQLGDIIRETADIRKFREIRKRNCGQI